MDLYCFVSVVSGYVLKDDDSRITLIIYSPLVNSQGHASINGGNILTIVNTVILDTN